VSFKRTAPSLFQRRSSIAVHLTALIKRSFVLLTADRPPYIPANELSIADVAIECSGYWHVSRVSKFSDAKFDSHS